MWIAGETAIVIEAVTIQRKSSRRGVKLSISLPAVQRLDAVHEARRHDVGAARGDGLGHAVDGHLERALGDVAGLQVRVRVQRADAALLEGELHQHQLGQIEDDAAAGAIELA